MPVLVDTNVLLDIATEDPEWFDWSVARLAQAANRDGLAINPIVYAEPSVHYESLEAALSGHPFARLALPWDAAFVAGKAYRRYRRPERASLLGKVRTHLIVVHRSAGRSSVSVRSPAWPPAGGRAKLPRIAGVVAGPRICRCPGSRNPSAEWRAGWHRRRWDCQCPPSCASGRRWLHQTGSPTYSMQSATTTPALQCRVLPLAHRVPLKPRRFPFQASSCRC